MAVGMKINQQADGLAALKELIDLVKSPTDIVKAHEIARQQMELTEMEQEKLDAAKLFIAQYDRLSKEIADGQASLAADVEAFNKARQAFEDNATVKDAELKQLDAVIKATAASQVENDRRQAAERKGLEEDKESLAQEYANMVERIRKDAATNERVRLANEAEASRLAEIKTRLEDKATKMREVADI